MKSKRFSLRTRLGNKVRHHILPHVFRITAPLLWVKRRARPHRAMFEIFSGKISGGEDSIQVYCGIQDQIRHHVLKLIFGTPPEGKPSGEQKIHRVFRGVRNLAPSADIALAPATEGQHAWMDDGTWFSLPEWLNGYVRIPLPESVRRSDSLKSVARLLRRQDYGYIATRDEKLFEEFYFRMHEPYIKKIYGDGACLDSFAEKRAATEDFDLLLLYKKSAPGEYLAGLLIIHEPQVPRLWAFGVRDGDRQLVRDGVLSALYLFSFEFLAAAGHRDVFMGGSRPFLRDGVLNAKRRYAQRLTAARWQGFGLKILKLTPAVKTFLLGNPFIFRSHGKIYGAIFLEKLPDAAEVAELHHQFYYEGLERLVIWVFDDGHVPAPVLTPELAARTEFRPAAALVSENLHLP